MVVRIGATSKSERRYCSATTSSHTGSRVMDAISWSVSPRSMRRCRRLARFIPVLQ